jgi:hypothetical protein
MTNLALSKKFLEKVGNPAAATDGEILGYTGTAGFSQVEWPSYMTIDLEDVYKIKCIRILLWDNLGQKGNSRDSRLYKYRLLCSVNDKEWNVLFDLSDEGSNGWQIFDFIDAVECQFIRIHALHNSKNRKFHIVQIEAYEEIPDPLDADIRLKREIKTRNLLNEIGDGLPLAKEIQKTVLNIERFVEETDMINKDKFNDLIFQLKQRVRDIGAIESNVESIRNEIIDPVKSEIGTLGKAGKYSILCF